MSCRRPGIAEKKMFGGIAFLLNGNMLVAVWQDSLIVRLGFQENGSYRSRHVRPFDVTGRPMRGWIMVEPDGTESDRQLDNWIDNGPRNGPHAAVKIEGVTNPKARPPNGQSLLDDPDKFPEGIESLDLMTKGAYHARRIRTQGNDRGGSRLVGSCSRAPPADRQLDRLPDSRSAATCLAAVDVGS